MWLENSKQQSSTSGESNCFPKYHDLDFFTVDVKRVPAVWFSFGTRQGAKVSDEPRTRKVWDEQELARPNLSSSVPPVELSFGENLWSMGCVKEVWSHLLSPCSFMNYFDELAVISALFCLHCYRKGEFASEYRKARTKEDLVDFMLM